MISKDKIREIGSFAASFARIFESELQGVCSINLHAVYRISGLVSGYVSVVYNAGKYPGNLSQRRSALLRCREKIQEEFPGFNITEADIDNWDLFAYNLRKREPQMTFNIQLKRCSIELYITETAPNEERKDKTEHKAF